MILGGSAPQGCGCEEPRLLKAVTVRSRGSSFYRPRNSEKIRWEMLKNNLFGQCCRNMRKSFDENFLKHWGLSGAKACKSCRSRQELSNEYLLAKFGVDTEENEPCKVCSFGWNFEIWAVQKYVHLVDLVKSFPTSIYKLFAKIGIDTAENEPSKNYA